MSIGAAICTSLRTLSISIADEALGPDVVAADDMT
jgi:hypothetical protein